MDNMKGGTNSDNPDQEVLWAQFVKDFQDSLLTPETDKVNGLVVGAPFSEETLRQYTDASRMNVQLSCVHNGIERFLEYGVMAEKLTTAEDLKRRVDLFIIQVRAFFKTTSHLHITVLGPYTEEGVL